MQRCGGREILSLTSEQLYRLSLPDFCLLSIMLEEVFGFFTYVKVEVEREKYSIMNKSLESKYTLSILMYSKYLTH